MFFEMVKWLNANQGFTMVILTFVYIITTILIFVANYFSVKELKRTREEQARPHVIVYLDVFPSQIVQLIIHNIGKTVAKNVKIISIPELNKPHKFPLKESYFFTKAIPNIPPEYKYFAFVGTFNELKTKTGAYEKYSFTVTYNDSFNKNKYSETFHSDLNVTANVPRIKELKMHDLVEAVSKYGEKLLKK